MRLLLVRHGQTAANIVGALDTRPPGAGLTALGRRQAENVVGALAGTTITTILASDLARAQQTAAPLAAARGLAVERRPGWREIAAGDLEMRDDEAARRAYRETTFAWSAGHLDAALPGGESGADALARLDRVVRDAAGPDPAGRDDTVAIVGHGTATRLWLASRTDNYPGADMRSRLLHNGGIVAVDAAGESADDPPRWRIASWYDPPEFDPDDELERSAPA
jgi:broad specificity phosphatase PhoE